MPGNDDLLREAIDRSTPVMLILPSAGLVKQCRSRFVRADGDTIVFESIPDQAEAIDALIRSEQPVTILFRSDTQRVEFVARVLDRRRGFRLNADTMIEALRVAWPATIKAVQRRSDYRVSITAETDAVFKCWRIAEQDDLAAVPALPTMVVIDVRDLSTGGFGGIWKRRRDDPRTLAAGQRFRVEARVEETTLLLEGRLRFLERIADSDNQRIGVQFSILANRMQDRQKVMLLTKLVGELQRQELRRKRMAR